jgi:hypothetical protein
MMVKLQNNKVWKSSNDNNDTKSGQEQFFRAFWNFGNRLSGGRQKLDQKRGERVLPVLD